MGNIKYIGKGYVIGGGVNATTTTTTSTTTTIANAPNTMMKVVKAVAADVVEINTYDTDGVRIDFHSPAGSGDTWYNALNPAQLYDITVTLTPSGRASASITMVDGAGTTRASTGAGTTVSATDVTSNTLGIIITIGS